MPSLPRLTGDRDTGSLLRTDSRQRHLPAMGPLLTQSFDNILLEARDNGRLHSWNVAYQRILPGAFTAEVAYVGNRAEDDWNGENINAGFIVGADNAGRPLFVKFGRTGNTTVQVKDARPRSSTIRCRSRSTAACAGVWRLPTPIRSGAPGTSPTTRLLTRTDSNGV